MEQGQFDQQAQADLNTAQGQQVPDEGLMQGQIMELHSMLLKMQGENQRLEQQCRDESVKRQANEARLEEALQELSQSPRGTHEGGTGASMVNKWAPDDFSGTEQDWPTFNLKFRSFTGQQCQGKVGTWMDHARENRDTCCKTTSLETAAKQPAEYLYGALIATCNGVALKIVERAGAGQGIEAWKLLIKRYEQQTKQSQVMRRIEILQWDFAKGDLQDRLESLDRAVQKFAETPGGAAIDDDTQIGIIIKGLSPGSVGEHLLLHSEKCDDYLEFRVELDTIIKARASNLMTSMPMDLDLLKKSWKGGGKGGKGDKGLWYKDPSNDKYYSPDFTCHICNKVGHKSTVC